MTYETIKSMDDAVRALEKVVEKYGADTLYVDRDPLAAAVQEDGTVSCRYVDRSGRPMCIVGVVAVEEWGVDPEVFVDPVNNFIPDGTIDNWGDTPSTRRFQELVGVSAEAAEVLLHAQITQDAGNPWGDALERAKSAAVGIRKFNAEQMKAMEKESK